MLMNMWIIRKNSMKNHFLKKLFLHIYKKRKYTLDTRAVLLIFSIELKIYVVVVQSIHQKSKKW